MIPEEVARFIGKSGDTVMMEVERGAIKKYADAVDDPNPAYWDEEYANNSKHGSIIAPPGFFGWPIKWSRPGPTIIYLAELSEEVGAALAQAGYSRGLGAGIEFEFFCPVRAGDILAATPRVIDIYERQGKAEKLIIWIVETTYCNQNGDLVAKARTTGINR